MEISSHVNCYLNFPFLYLMEKQSDEHYRLEPQRGTHVGAHVCVCVCPCLCMHMYVWEYE